MPIRRTPTHVRMLAAAAATALIALGPSPRAAPAQEAAPAAPDSVCAGPEFRQFDFWLGVWEVKNDEGRLLGHNEIRRTAGGCALLESWRGASGGTGASINMYEPAAGRWNQVWVGNDGTILRLRGGIEDGAMVLAGGERETRRGRVSDRIRWTPLPDGRVEQLWEISTDGGKSWRAAFRGLYERAEASGAP